MSDEVQRLTAERDMLKEGMKGDYDLDMWLDWAMNVKRLVAERDALRDMLDEIVNKSKSRFIPMRSTTKYGLGGIELKVYYEIIEQARKLVKNKA